MGYPACLYGRVSYPTGMPACQQAQPSIQNAEGNLRNQPEISVTRSTAKISDRYTGHFGWPSGLGRRVGGRSFGLGRLRNWRSRRGRLQLLDPWHALEVLVEHQHHASLVKAESRVDFKGWVNRQHEHASNRYWHRRIFHSEKPALLGGLDFCRRADLPLWLGLQLAEIKAAPAVSNYGFAVVYEVGWAFKTLLRLPQSFLGFLLLPVPIAATSEQGWSEQKEHSEPAGDDELDTGRGNSSHDVKKTSI